MPTERSALTDAALRTLKPGQALIDTLSPLRVRVSSTGHASFYVWHRFGGAANPTARVIGKVGTVKLVEARETAREWIKLAKAKQDPAKIERERREAEAMAAASTFDRVLEDYARLVLVNQRRGQRVKRELERNFLADWKGKSLTSITRADVIRAVDAITARGKRYEAHNALINLKAMFGWAVDRTTYGLESAPTDRLRPARIIGPKQPRQRVLSDDELFALWRATGRVAYPWGPMARLLLLTGCRHNEVLQARWRELHARLVHLLRQGGDIDWRRVPDEVKLLSIPPARFKSGCVHKVPLSDLALAELAALPRWNTGDHLFSFDGGRSPAHRSVPAKAALDRRMLRTLKALARVRGEDPATVELEGWVLHDLRRTTRTGLSALRVPENVAELVLGHARRGLQRTYDLHAFEDEMRQALQRWADRLKVIVTPEPDNVIELRATA